MYFRLVVVGCVKQKEKQKQKEGMGKRNRNRKRSLNPLSFSFSFSFSLSRVLPKNRDKMCLASPLLLAKFTLTITLKSKFDWLRKDIGNRNRKRERETERGVETRSLSVPNGACLSKCHDGLEKKIDLENCLPHAFSCSYSAHLMEISLFSAYLFNCIP